MAIDRVTLPLPLVGPNGLVDQRSFHTTSEESGIEEHATRGPVQGCVMSTNSDILRHTATATDGSFDIDLPAGAKGRAILKRAGGVAYVCRFHPGMKGRLEVAP